MKIQDMQIQNLTLETTGCTPRRLRSRSVSQLMCAATSYPNAERTAAARAHVAVHANTARGFWLAAPIFGTKPTIQWTRPD